MSTDAARTLRELNSVRRDVNVIFYELTYSGGIGRDRAADADSRTRGEDLGRNYCRRRS